MKKAVATSTLIKLIVVTIVILVVVGFFGPKLYGAAKTFFEIFAPGEAKEPPVKPTIFMDRLKDVFEACALQQGDKCLCDYSLSGNYLEKLPAGAEIILSNEGDKIKIRYGSDVRYIENAKLCWISGFSPLQVGTYNPRIKISFDQKQAAPVYDVDGFGVGSFANEKPEILGGAVYNLRVLRLGMYDALCLSRLDLKGHCYEGGECKPSCAK